MNKRRILAALAGLLLAVPAHAMLLPVIAGTSASLVADFGMGTVYSGTQASAGTSVTLTVKTDGTWTITFGSGDTPSGTPTSGTWVTNGGSGVGSQFEVQFTTAGAVGSPNISNDAAAFTQITSDLAITVSKNLANALADVTVNIRKLGSSSTELTDTAQFQANGA